MTKKTQSKLDKSFPTRTCSDWDEERSIAFGKGRRVEIFCFQKVASKASKWFEGIHGEAQAQR